MFSYEKLEVYQKAFAANQVYRALKKNSLISLYMKNQLGRAATSVMLNIAEGSGKFMKRDRKNFFITARGSAFETASLISFLCKEGDFPQDSGNELLKNYDEISRMLFAMIKNLEKDANNNNISS